MENLVSIVTINLNNIEGLKSTVRSVLSQTFTNYEYIIIDGNSKDGSANLIKELKHNNIKYLIEADTGIYNAMNKGIRISQGKYILFLNSGDELADPGMLSYFVNNQKNEDIIYGDLIAFNETETHLIKYPDKLTFNQFYTKSIPHSGGSFIKSELFKKHGLYDENYKIVSDWKFFIKTIVFNNCTFKHHSVPFSRFNLKGISTINLNEMNIEREKVLNEFVPEMILKDYKILNSKLKDTNAETVYIEIKKNNFTYFIYKFNYKLSLLLNKLFNR